VSASSALGFDPRGSPKITDGFFGKQSFIVTGIKRSRKEISILDREVCTTIPLNTILHVSSRAIFPKYPHSSSQILFEGEGASAPRPWIRPRLGSSGGIFKLQLMQVLN
ncbi:unnamed protein product, partial [Sphacelaria rigidula]